MENEILMMGIGNILMGDEGVGVIVARELQKRNLPRCEVVDGGTGSFFLLEYFHRYRKIVLIDATLDGKQAGTITVLKPRFSSDYPTTLTAHDIGLKDLLDSVYLLDHPLNVRLVAVSIKQIQQASMELSPEIEAAVPRAVETAIKQYRELLDTVQ
ncbi:MAG: HyaD/HybD family hydrogenase maturation endopeptidase [Calditrichia bacterium]